MPEKSKLDRPRKIKTSAGKYGRKRAKVATNKSAIGPHERLKEFPDNGLSVVNGKLSCRACSILDLPLKKSSIQSHLSGELHKRNMSKRDKSPVTMLSYKILVENNQVEVKAAGATLALDVNAYRMTVAHALLKSGTPFTILDSGSEVRQLFEDNHSTCPKQACSDLIPLLHKKEQLETLKELEEATAFSISSDGTINVAEALAMIVRFVCPKKTIQQRVLSLRFLAHPLTGNSLAAQIIMQVMTVGKQNPSKLRFNTADGCATNGIANEVMKTVFTECSDLICVSHTSNLPMKLFETATPTAHKFLGTWSQCLTQGSKVRVAARQALGEGAMKNHAIRWMAEYRTAVQVGDKFDLIKDIVENQDVGCESLIASLRAIINQPANGAIPSGEQTLRLELALIKDAGESIASFCNNFEGDGFLAPYAYDRWNDMNDHLRVVVERYIEEDYPSTCCNVAREIAPYDLDSQQILMQLTVSKAIVVAQKLESDSLTRFRDTLKVLRGCRLLGYQFVKNTTVEALEEEVHFVQLLPIAVPIIDGLLLELKTYKRIANTYNNDEEDGWSFWMRYYNSLPLWYKVAAEVALVMCSSASVERVFSQLNCMFDKH